MLDAFGLGVLAQSSLLITGLLVCWIKVPTQLVGILAGLGAGAVDAEPVAWKPQRRPVTVWLGERP